jgi:trk system potassium uptake protein TrkH
MRNKISNHPMLYPIIGFLLLITLGTILLLMPSSSKNGLSFANALFIATSASCVNGLAVISVGQELTDIGQGILMVLIEMGGIGVMILSTMIMLFAHSKMNFGQRSVLMSSYSAQNNSSMNYIVKRVIIVTIAVEICGAVMLFSQFDDMQLKQRIFISIFHSISAFCNAGFSVWDNSMQNFSTNVIVNISMIFLIICGSFGFLALSELVYFKKSKAKNKHLTLHTRLALVMTLILIPAGMIFVLAMEWNGALSGHSLPNKIMIGLFQSVTTRSAGFSTMNFASLGVPLLFTAMVFMFIGANPGSCGGGIKTTTTAIIVLLGINRFLGREKTQVFNRTIPEETVEKAMRIFVLSVVVIATAGILLFIFETANLTVEAGQNRFLGLFFEIVSAFSTCGLSMGVTEDLTNASKVLISVVMFVGRLGPLVLVQGVIRLPQSGAYYSEENVMVG